jgi:hypothetical protein
LYCRGQVPELIADGMLEEAAGTEAAGEGRLVEQLVPLPRRSALKSKHDKAKLSSLASLARLVASVDEVLGSPSVSAVHAVVVSFGPSVDVAKEQYVLRFDQGASTDAGRAAEAALTKPLPVAKIATVLVRSLITLGGEDAPHASIREPSYLVGGGLGAGQKVSVLVLASVTGTAEGGLGRWRRRKFGLKEDVDWVHEVVVKEEVKDEKEEEEEEEEEKKKKKRRSAKKKPAKVKKHKKNPVVVLSVVSNTGAGGGGEEPPVWTTTEAESEGRMWLECDEKVKGYLAPAG